MVGDVPHPDSHGAIEGDPKLPEGEDIKKEVWSQLGKMVGHTNVISANLLQQSFRWCQWRRCRIWRKM